MKTFFTKLYINYYLLTATTVIFLGSLLSQTSLANTIDEQPLIPPLNIAQLPRQPEPLPIPDLPPPDEEQPETTPEAPAPETPLEGEANFDVDKIEVIGSSIFNETELNPILEPLEGRIVTSEELRQAVQQITQLYLNEGYLNSRATLGSIEGGIVQIEVIEGTIPDDQIEIIGADRLYNYVLQRVKLGIGTPLNVRKLEDQLRLLKSDPLFERVEASLRPPTEEELGQERETLQSESRLVVRVREADPFFGSIGADNYSPPSIGGERMLLNLGYRNVSGLGDQVYVSYRPRFQAFFDTYRVETGYRVPVNAMNGTVGIGALIEENKVVNSTPQIEDLNITGNSQRYFIDYRQPFIRTTRQEFALSWGFRYYQGRTFLDGVGVPFAEGADQKGITRTSVITFGQDYTYRQPSGAWAVRSQLNFGIGALNATDNAAPIPDGHFFSWLLQGQRVQVLNENNLLIVQADLQLTPDSLLSSEQFVIGGAQSVRGYRQNLLAGDNGFRFSIEDRITLVRNKEELPFFTLAPFFDMGVVWNSDDNPNSIVADQNFIAGLGLGFILQPVKDMTVRLDYAPPLIDVSTRGDNVQDHGFYFSVNYNF